MKREFLESLDLGEGVKLPKSAIDAIMAESEGDSQGPGNLPPAVSRALSQVGSMKPVKIDTTAIPKVEVKLLCSTFLEAVQAFYEDPQNLADFEAWQKAGGNRTVTPCNG